MAARANDGKPLASELPTSLEGRRLLVVGGSDEGAGELEPKGAAAVQRWDPSAGPLEAEEGFDFVLCEEALNHTAHPANLLSDIWHRTVEGGTLLLGCRVMTAVDLSMYARFVDASVGIGDSEWLPGRLALRWSVETSGFDFDRWIDSPGQRPEPGEAIAYLVATRVFRYPALDVSIPEPVSE